MTEESRKQQLEFLRGEFYKKETTDEHRIKILLQIREWAEEEMPESRCVYCHHGGVAVPYDYALIEGHCYSEAGIRDYTRITKVCEYCFDKMHKEYEEEIEEADEVEEL